jgi:hypothetical protein
MARPRVIKLENNAEIVLKNLTPELADKVAGMINDLISGTAPVKGEETPVLAEYSPLPHEAVGLCQQNGKWVCAIVKYDPATKAAQVASLIPAEGRDVAMERFKIEVVSRGIIN